MINLTLAPRKYYLRAGKQYDSITLQAVRHLMTDVWTSAGVLAGVAAVALTGWQPLDSLVALAVAINIVWTGIRIMRGSVSGLMDSALSEEDQVTIREILEEHCVDSVGVRALMAPLGRREIHHRARAGAGQVERGTRSPLCQRDRSRPACSGL